MKSRCFSKGFALPTVIITSVVMFAILVVATGTVTSSRVALDSQYYENLAHDAAESGLAYAETCLGEVAGTATSTQWSNSATATISSGQNCTSAAINGADCSNSAGPSQCYVVSRDNVRTRFVIQPLVINSFVFTVTAIGYTDIYRTTGDKWKTYTSTLSLSTSTDQYGLSSGNDTTCSVQEGQLFCWGKNNYGQVGNGTTSTVKIPTQVKGLFVGQYVYEVGTGISHTCAIAGPTSSISTAARLYCWGSNDLYQYGIGENTTSSTTPMLAANTGSRYPAAVSARDHTCTIQVSKTNAADRVEACWGDNTYGQSGESGSATATPTLLNPKPSMGYGFRLRASPYSQLSNVKKINSVSGNTSCGIDGTKAYCIGRNNAGQLGDGTTSGTDPRVEYAIGMTSATQIVTNAGKVCAINAGRTWCWGGNGSVSSGPPDFRLDSGPNFNTSSEHGTPKRVITAGPNVNATVTDIAMTDWNLCQVIAGSVWCSGYNDYGQLGQGYVSGPAGGDATVASQVRSANNAVKVNGALVGKKVTKIVGGNNHFCAITADRIVYCWGLNNFGQLGDGTTTTRDEPVGIKLPPSSVY